MSHILTNEWIICIGGITMANRPVFYSLNVAPFYEKCDNEFDFHPGFSVSQKQKNIRGLHESYLQQYPTRNILEISSKSEEKLGVMLSAFNLQLSRNNQTFTVETAFQGSKVFENGTQYKDLYYATSLEAKKDERLKESGKIVCFEFEGEVFPNEPQTFFYNWIYISALAENKELASEIMRYDSFSDIEFNEKKSINCQAIAAAIYVGLAKSSMLEKALSSKEEFLNIVYGQENRYEQISLFD